MGFIMENVTSKEGHFDFDLELGIACDNHINNSNLDLSGCEAIGSYRMKQFDYESSDGERVISSVATSCDDDAENVKMVVGERKVVDKEVPEKKFVNERPKAMSAKKPPKPPRPPRGLSLDSSDQKLIRELHELAKLKRVRIERMKAVKKAREAKVGSSKNHLFATLLAVLFCLVVLFQGISSRTSSAASFQGSPISSGVAQDSIISIQHDPISSAHFDNGPGSESSRVAEQSSGVDTIEQAN